MDFNGYRSSIRDTRSTICLVFACLTAIGASSAQAGDAPVYDRPGFGFDPAVLPVGGLAIEQGLPDAYLDNEQGTRTELYTTDTLFRLGIGKDLELQLGTSPFNRLTQRTDGVTQLNYGRGDSTLGLKFAPASNNPVWSWGLLGTIDFADGATQIRLPQRQYTLGLTVGQQLDDQRTLSYFAQWQREGNTGTYQLATNYTYAMTKVWGVFGEALLQHANGRNGALLGAGITYLPNERLQWDVSLDHRIAGHIEDWQAGIGIALYFGPG